jgi:WD40 repeat protein
VSGGADGTLRLWTIEGKVLAEPFRGHDNLVLGVAFSPDGKSIVSGGVDGTVRLWTLDGKAAAAFKAHNFGVWSVAFSPNGRYILRLGTGGVDAAGPSPGDYSR